MKVTLYSDLTSVSKKIMFRPQLSKQKYVETAVNAKSYVLCLSMDIRNPYQAVAPVMIDG
jgi:hypothetical protein